MEGGYLMDVSSTEVWLRNGNSSHEEESAQDGARHRLFCIVDPASRLLVAALVSYTAPDEQTIAGLLPGSGEKQRESEENLSDQ